MAELIRISAAALAVPTLIVALAGCGGDGDGGNGGDADTGDRSGEARDVVLGYFREVVADRSEKACETYLTPDGVRDIYGRETCEGVVDFVTGPVRVESVEVTDDSARVVVRLSPAERDRRVANLEDEGGALKIDSVERP
jgi:hypothetical protein